MFLSLSLDPSISFLVLYLEQRWTDVVHNCPKSKRNGGTLDVTAAIIERPESLKFAETISQMLQDYIRLKCQEAAAGGAK